MNLFKRLAQGIEDTTESAMIETAEAICTGMRSRLAAGGHIDTGALYESIRQETEKSGGTITTRIYADAESADGTMYAEFIELGTGAAHGRAGGRVGTWRYQDMQGQWHTTDGMDADPFIQPSVDECLPMLGNTISRYITDIAKYRGRSE